MKKPYFLILIFIMGCCHGNNKARENIWTPQKEFLRLSDKCKEWAFGENWPDEWILDANKIWKQRHPDEPQIEYPYPGLDIFIDLVKNSCEKHFKSGVKQND